MLEKFLDRIAFESYEDLKANYKVHVPAGFNFAYDVVDEGPGCTLKKMRCSGVPTRATAVCLPSVS